MAIEGWNILQGYQECNDDLILRRFMNLEKFSHLLTTQYLYMAPASVFDDSFEGHYSFLDHGNWDSQLENLGLDQKSRKVARDSKDVIANHNQSAVVVSCWTKADEHSPRMWREYAGGCQNGVIVETTVRHLRDELGSDFLIIPVIYADYRQVGIPKHHLLIPFSINKNQNMDGKRKCVLLVKWIKGARVGSPRCVDVDLHNLVSRIRLHPGVNAETNNKVKSLVKEHAPFLELGFLGGSQSFT